MIDRQQLIGINPIAETIQSYGISLKKSGVELKGLCPFHNENTPSFHVNPEKQTFYCFGCGVGGSVIDFVAKKENLTIKQSMEKLNENKQPKEFKKEKAGLGKVIAKYDYQDEQGKTLFKVFRYEPKDFRQAHQKDGKVVWGLDGVRRVLYRLPEIIKCENVIVCEGEKDVDSLINIGLDATCNAMGAGKWLNAYSETLKGKNVVIIPDSDEPGEKHCEKVRESLVGKAKSIKVVRVPEPFKDITAWIESNKTLDAKSEIQKWIDRTNQVGLDIPVYSMQEMEDRYREFVKNNEKNTLTFDWLPSLKAHVPGLVPGDVMAILADTGTGKTAIAQNIAYHAKPLKVLFFEIELADPLMFQRFTQLNYKVDGLSVENAFKNDIKLSGDNKMSHIFVCPNSKQTTADIEKFIIQSELKIGERPQVVVIDYVGLIHGEGKSRYEKLSNIAEDIKRMAKSTNTIIIITSQIHRKGDDDSSEIYLHDAKDSGSVENSSGLVLGCWKESQTRMTMKILKNTRGTSGPKIHCNFDGRTMTITEASDKIVSYAP